MKNRKNMFTITKDEAAHIYHINLFMEDIQAKLKTIKHKEADVLNIFASVLSRYITYSLSPEQSINPDTRLLSFRPIFTQDEMFVIIESKGERGISIAINELNHFLLHSDIILSKIDSALTQRTGLLGSFWTIGSAAISISGKINELLTSKLKTNIENISPDDVLLTSNLKTNNENISTPSGHPGFWRPVKI